MKKADMGIALYILAAFVMFIITIPSGFLDVLLAINIAIAFTVMFTCMFGIFPSSRPFFCLPPSFVLR